MRVRRNYEPEFRRDAVALIERSQRPVRHVASSLGIPQTTLNGWYTEEMARRAGRGRPQRGIAPVSTSPAAETPEQKLARLERENSDLRKELERLRMDRDILKKAAAFFAKENE